MSDHAPKFHFEDPEEERHYQALHAALFNTYDLKDVGKYIAEKTYLKGERYSFKDHEFQLDILQDTERDCNYQKCAQIGASELFARYGLGVAAIMPYFSVIMTMPFSGDASNFTKTRMDPIISESPDLKAKIDPNLDNTELKGIGSSLLYMRGCNGITAALSVPADMLIHDEVDRSDPDILAQFQSRIKHSKWKITRKFGTPTVDKVGIALAMSSSKRWRRMCKCDKCNHTFAPNFHSDIVIPGYDKEKKEITKYTIEDINWQDAFIKCPRCGRQPSLQAEHREWVCENPRDNFDAKGRYLTPFEVPNIVTIPSLVKEITKYNSWGEFCNQALGETATQSNSQLVEQDFVNTKFEGDLASSELHCLGIDVGQVCHICVGRITLGGVFMVVHFEQCVLDDLATRKLELTRKYRIVTTVIDAFPETNMVHQMQKMDKNLYGGVYHADAKLATYSIVMVDEDKKKGKLPINQAKIHRNLNFDEIMDLLKAKMVLWQAQDAKKDRLFMDHCLDMVRKEEVDKNDGLVYVWQKSKEGTDHFMHALGYLHVACRLAPTASRNINFGAIPIVHRIKVATQKETTVFGRIRS